VPPGWAIEKAPEITACEAMTVAAVASTTSGTRPACGIRWKNGALMALGSSRISAP
jgi:hypothetical protein